MSTDRFKEMIENTWFDTYKYKLESGELSVEEYNRICDEFDLPGAKATLLFGKAVRVKYKE